jgi:ribulose-5-phosphate 4-epimerase/fuculose-1-phosphate aldolase
VAGIGLVLSPAQELACALRLLAQSGFSEGFAGHITVASNPGAYWSSPWGLWWGETRASDVCLIDENGTVTDGRWDVTPAIHIHTGLHRARPAAQVVIHNHPYYSRLLAATGTVPLALHQTSSLLHDDLAWISEYDGEVSTRLGGELLAARIGEKNAALLANHGVVVTGATVAEAVYRATCLETACRLTWDVLAGGMPYTTIPGDIQDQIKRSLLTYGVEAFWAGAVRQLLENEPGVLQ